MNLPVLPSRVWRLGASALGLLLLTAGLQPQSAFAQDAVVTYHHHDATGNAVAMTDAAGNVVWRARLRPFGRGSVQLSERPLRFAGQPLESDLTADGGLYHFGARMFDPFTGRFLSPDPLRLGQGRLEEPQRFNLYAYALNNPYRYSDSSGLLPLSEAEARATLKHLANVLDSLGAPVEARYARILSSAQAVSKQIVERGRGVLLEKTFDRVGFIKKAAETGAAEMAAGETKLEGFKKLLHAYRGSGVFKAGGKLLQIITLVFAAEGVIGLVNGSHAEAGVSFYDLSGADSALDIIDHTGLYRELLPDPRETIKELANCEWDDGGVSTEPLDEADQASP